MNEEVLESEMIDYSDKDDLIKIVKFERRQYDTLIGYRQNNRVVYASVATDLDDVAAKHQGYTQVRDALKYEQTLDKPSIDGSDMEPIEIFTILDLVTTTVKINGLSVVVFDDETVTKTVKYTALSYDQYNDVIESQTFEWTFDNADSKEVVSITIEGIVATLNVTVQCYKEPEPNEFDVLTNYILDVDMRLLILEMELI